MPQPAWTGCAGRVANGINTVHLPYIREKMGHALAHVPYLSGPASAKSAVPT
jgi:hypothetical protein